VTEQSSRPATLEDLKTLLRALNAHGVDYLLIGGYALAAHGYQRATTDIDIVEAWRSYWVTYIPKFVPNTISRFPLPSRS
jgi:hypothetical protein